MDFMEIALEEAQKSFENGEVPVGAIIVKDNGQGIEPDHLEKLNTKLKGEESDVGGIGVVNVHERIKLLYGKEYGIDIFSDYEKNTIVLVHIPVSKTPKTEVVKLV